MNFCENGIKLIKQSKHENLYEYDVLLYNLIFNKYKYIERINRINFTRNKSGYSIYFK